MFATEPKTRTPDETAGEDSLQRYLNEIGRYPLLTRSQEIQLNKRAEAGDRAARQRSHVLTRRPTWECRSSRRE
jgi:DNA-directed RNA polymerase sigma subunit (sigma70/sigma32)